MCTITEVWTQYVRILQVVHPEMKKNKDGGRQDKENKKI